MTISLLLLFSATIADILAVSLMQSLMVHSEVSQKKNFISSTGKAFLSHSHRLDGKYAEVLPMSAVMPKSPGLTSFLVLDRSGSVVYRESDVNSYLDGLLGKAGARALAQQKDVQERFGSVWGVFWWHSHSMAIAAPLLDNGCLQGAAAAIVPLESIYDNIRMYNRPVFIYIIINTAILSLVGFSRLFNLYFRPLDRIIKQADRYEEKEDFYFAFRREDDEFHRLSSALNSMIDKISQDKKKLKETVESLEKSNEDLKRAQKEILQAEKMASIGRLAAGIAHEIGNPIGIVLGYVDLLKRDDLDRTERIDYLNRAEKETQRINRIIRQLLDLARPGRYDALPAAVSTTDILHQIVEVMRLQPLMKGIRIDVHSTVKNDTVLADAEQLRQVFLNLLLNSADAIRSRPNRPQDGLIEIRLETQEDPRQPRKGWISIRLRDNGIGIDPQSMEQIFDPFYTTKEPGKGTGLGLAVSYMIIEKTGGSMVAENHPESGATMVVRLPLAHCIGDAADQDKQQLIEQQVV